MAKELIDSKPDVFCDLTKQDGRNVSALVERDSRALTLRVPKLLMRPALTDFRETEGDKDGDDLTRFENRDISHPLRNSNVLDTYKLRLQDGLTVFDKHGNNFLKVMVEFVQGLTLRVRTRKTRHKSHEEFGLWAPFNYCGKSSHDLLRLND